MENMGDMFIFTGVYGRIVEILHEPLCKATISISLDLACINEGIETIII